MMAELVYNEQGCLLFTEEMKQEYTLLAPQMLPVHFTMLQKVFQFSHNGKLLSERGW